jgi:hypothetical protein
MMPSRRRVLEWLLDIEEDEQHPERRGALRNGGELSSLAVREGLIEAGPQHREELARMLAQLEADGWLAWHYMRWPADREPHPPHPRNFTDRHLQRAEDVRLLPAGVEAARRGSHNSGDSRPRLEAEQIQLLGRLVTAARAVEPSRRIFTVAARPPNGDFITGAGLERPALRSDVDALEHAQTIRPLMTWESGMQFVITPLGFTVIDDAADREPVWRMEETIMRYLDSRQFASAYPLALQRWKEATELLWGPTAAAEITTIGHKLRESVQEFASALVERHRPINAPPEVTKTVARLKAVIATARAPSAKPSIVIQALVAYWGEVNDLLQRQVHGAQKEGSPLTLEDARRAVFHTAIVMYEVDAVLKGSSQTDAA